MKAGVGNPHGTVRCGKLSRVAGTWPWLWCLNGLFVWKHPFLGASKHVFFLDVFFHDDVGNGDVLSRKFLQSLQILWIRSGDVITCGLCEPLTTESRQGPMFHMNLYQIHFYGRYGAILLVGCPCGMIFSWAEFLGGLEGMILQTSDWKIPNHLHPWKFNMSSKINGWKMYSLLF